VGNSEVLVQRVVLGPARSWHQFLHSLARNVLSRTFINTAVGMQEREKATRLMKTTDKQTVRQRSLGGFPRFSIPPELLVLRELELLDISERFSQLAGLHRTIPQEQRN
jgi:hypothetical protein